MTDAATYDICNTLIYIESYKNKETAVLKCSPNHLKIFVASVRHNHKILQGKKKGTLHCFVESL